MNGAVRFKNQAQFNPLKFLNSISEELTIYEYTKAVEIDEKNNKVITDRGTICADHIVVATHYPIMNVPGFYFMKMHQERSYVLALKNAEAHKLDGMYIDIDKEGYEPTLSLYSDNITEIEYIEEEINISITGNRVDSNASKELKKIRKRIDMCEGKIKEKLEKFLEMIYERIKDLKMNIDVISELDMIWAKAKYSNDIQGIQPKINDYGYIKIVKGCNPLIKNPVPLDFEIGSNYRSLIITGPNAGGKTVVLKTVGMLTLQTMLGFHIKAKRDTEVSIFNKIFVDIGDNQSIENALSTFSSHVKNLAHIIKESNKSTLLLFDEIGSGTEPNEGAALAIAVLEDLYKKGCIII